MKKITLQQENSCTTKKLTMIRQGLGRREKELLNCEPMLPNETDDQDGLPIKSMVPPNLLTKSRKGDCPH